MKTPILIKQLFFTLVLIAGMNIYSSCDSCSRQPDGNSEGTRDGMDANGDTRGSEEPADNENSGSTEGTEGGSANDGKTASVAVKATTAGKTNTSASTSTSKSTGPSDAEITNLIENSDAKSNAVDKNGNPIVNSGASGTGSGTGTGSTGNNSKVTTREAQRSN